MLGGIPLIRILGMTAGALILFIGVFVLRAKPDSRLHQLFFALAVADGVSTFAFNLALSPVPDAVRVHAFLVYYYGFLGFLAFLVAFGAAFPRPLAFLHGRLVPAGIALGVVTVLVMVLHGLSPTSFWTAGRTGGQLTFALASGGRLVATAFILATAFIIVRAASILRHEPSPSHRLQGALVLGGMALGYAPFPTTVAILGFSDGASGTYLSSSPDIALSYWASLLTLLGVLATASFVLVEGRADRVKERNVALACLGGVLLITVLSIPSTSRATANTLQTLAVLVYPLLLGYAIARYEVLDINAQVRRAATTSLIGVGFTAAFLLFEVFVEQVLQQIVSAGVPTAVLSGVIAAVLTALISIPLARWLRRVARRLAPTLGEDDPDARKREIYRHALHGAALDGVIAPAELRVLARLRESLRISDSEHAAIAREVGLSL